MKRTFILLLSISILLYAVPANAKSSSIVSLDDFVYRFNFLSALMGDEHSLDDDNIEIMSTFDDTIMKATYNGCEVLSLFMNESMDEITSIYCTIIPENGTYDYLDDFILLLVLVFYAAGMDDTASGEYFEDVGAMIKNGNTKYETTVDGIYVTYSQSSAFGITFKLEAI